MSVNWKNYRENPLLLVHYKSVGETMTVTGYEPDEALLPTIQPQTVSENFVYELLEQENLDECVKFLACALHRRVCVWWGYVCVKLVMDEIAANIKAREAAGLPVDPVSLQAASMGFEKSKVQLPKDHSDETAREMAKQHGIPTSAEELMPPVPTEYGGKPLLADPRDWPEPSVSPSGDLHFMPEPVHSAPDREPWGIEELFQARKEALAEMSDSERAVFLKNEADASKEVMEMTGMSPSDYVVSQMKEWMQLEGMMAEPSSPLDKLSPGFDSFNQHVSSNIGQMQKENAALFAKIPAFKTPPIPTSERSLDALELTREWVVGPTDENARKAFEAGMPCKGDEQPAGLTAMSCFYSSNNIGHPGADPIVPPKQTAPRMIYIALITAAILPGGTTTPDERMELFMKKGMEVAQGSLIWDEAIRGDVAQDPWAGRSGFGRNDVSRAPEDI